MTILPIEFDLFGSPQMRKIFDENQKLQNWLNVEAAAALAQAYFGLIPKKAAQEIAKNATTNIVRLTRAKEIEGETHHDLFSMVSALTEACKGSGKKYVHYGLTSSDVEDTATAIQFKQALELIEKNILDLKKALMGIETTNPQHKEDRDSHLGEISRNLVRLKQLRERVVVGKILGLVGTGAAWGKSALIIQRNALGRLGIRPAGLVTQVIQRDLHAEVVNFLALLGACLNNLGLSLLRKNSTHFGGRTRDSIEQNWEQVAPIQVITGISRLLTGLTIPALENVPLWHERDLSNSANERFLFPIAFILADELFRLLTHILTA